MLMIAVIIVLGIAYGMSGKKSSDYRAMRVEVGQREREMCSKIAELCMYGTERRLSAGEKLIYGVLKYGGDKADKHTFKEALNELNYAVKYSGIFDGKQ